ncbi:winged helix-turn-helix domain-containing protein, partial [Acidobacteria bacterium AH-259-L09]|nr:winged helix-turn-helix domain-containing protein [Acidobacteria bacterium AH-259-L09]
HVSNEGGRPVEIDFRVGEWLIQPQLNRIVGAQKETRVEPKVMDVLVYLARHSEEVLPKERIIQAVWEDTFVTDDVLTHAISELRKAFQDDSKNASVIQTIPRRGYHLKGDVKWVVEESAQVEALAASLAASVRENKKRVSRITVGIGLVLLMGLGWWMKPDLSPPSKPVPLTKFVITPPPSAPLASLGSINLAISPDGRRIVYVARRDGTTQLYVRPLDEVVARPIPGTEGAEAFPFFSPDGESLGFFADGKLKRVSLKGGAPMTLCEAGPRWLGGAWNSQGTIVFSAGTETDPFGLYRVSATGGEPESLATPDTEKGELRYTCPKMLPGGKALLFDVRDTDGRHQIRVLSLETGEQKIVVEESINAYYAPTGHLVYQQTRWADNNGGNWSVVASLFDLERLEVMGASVPILDNVRGVDYSLSGDGTLVYIQAPATRMWMLGDSSLVWVDREGRERVLSQESRKYRRPRLSPDGKQVALEVFNEEENGRDVWIYDLEADVFRRLTFDEDREASLSWTLDGKWITFVSRGGLYRKRADGSRPTELLLKSPLPLPLRDLSWSLDRSTLAFSHRGDIWVLPMDGDKEPQPLITSPSEQGAPVFSPDGQYLAYSSTETGLNHVFVRSYPEPDVKWLVSDEEGGGKRLVWSPDGRELFYRSASPGGKMMVVPIATEPTFKAGKPRVLFEGAYLVFYDISPDGQRFLMIKWQTEGGRKHSITDGTPTRLIIVVQNWFEELKRLVPTEE